MDEPHGINRTPRRSRDVLHIGVASERLRSTARGGEMLVVGGAGPPPAPLPTDAGEGANAQAAADRHAGANVRAIEVAVTGARVDAGTLEVRILDRVHVDRL